MKKGIILSCFGLCFFCNAFGQRNKDLDVIIVIDEKLHLLYTNPKILIEETSGATYKINSNYHPGNLSIDASDFSKMVSDSVKSMFLEFTYYDNEDKKQKAYSYKIELKKGWLNDAYMILRIYNLNKKKYKKVFEPIEVGKNYTFELDSPSHTFKRIRKK